MHEVAGAAAIRSLAHQLVGLASDRDAQVGEVETAARDLSRALLPADAGPAPARLWIVPDETLTAIPFGLLTWNGAEGPLAISSHISVGPILPGAVQSPTSAYAAAISVFTAAAANGATNGLPLLASATQEAGWVWQAMPAAAQQNSVLDLDVLRRSLSVPGSWIHVAGHGRSRGGLQGHSGLWVDAEDGSDEPSFISWLDLVGEPLKAQLLVLNACDLAATGAGPINRASSFAVAVHAAGVDDVVAALWPVSDSAAALWVPAFYGELARQRNEGQYDPAGALAVAQQRLRASRMFRHPFHWASMVHVAGPRAQPEAGTR
jgi:CHAT domain-containing protein